VAPAPAPAPIAPAVMRMGINTAPRPRPAAALPQPQSAQAPAPPRMLLPEAPPPPALVPAQQLRVTVSMAPGALFGLPSPSAATPLPSIDAIRGSPRFQYGSSAAGYDLARDAYAAYDKGAAYSKRTSSTFSAAAAAAATAASRS
jgi:hypothetical protein